jgi:hypothetical protein
VGRSKLQADLAQLAPSLPATSVRCPQYGHAARIKSVEPHPLLAIERHIFECQECGLPRTYIYTFGGAGPHHRDHPGD